MTQLVNHFWAAKLILVLDSKSRKTSHLGVVIMDLLPWSEWAPSETAITGEIPACDK